MQLTLDASVGACSRVMGAAGANPSGHRAEGRIHPGQVGGPSQDRQTDRHNHTHDLDVVGRTFQGSVKARPVAQSIWLCSEGASELFMEIYKERTGRSSRESTQTEMPSHVSRLMSEETWKSEGEREIQDIFFQMLELLNGGLSVCCFRGNAGISL
ncbi:hypothetical protein AOLI_G00126540 [Acnodon oligacanthus]